MSRLNAKQGPSPEGKTGFGKMKRLIVPETSEYNLQLGTTKKCTYLHRKFTGAGCSGGLSNIPGRSNEDRFTVYNTDNNEACFGIFDGHNGDVASTLCARELVPRLFASIDVLERASQLSGEENGSNLDSHSAIFCEAAMNAYTAMNKVCHQESSAGTTATVLFTKIMEDGTTRVYCANAGDSRCTMAVETKSRLKVIDLSEDHSLSNIKEVWRVEAHVEAKRCQLPCDPMKLASNNPCSTREMCAYRSEKDLRKALYRIKHLRLFWDEGMHKDAAKYHFVSCLSQNAHLTTSLDTDILDDTLHTVASYQGERSLLPLAPDHTSLHCEADDLGITVHGEVEFLKQRKGSTITATTTYSQEINVSNDGSPRSIVSRSSDLEPVEDFFLPTPESCHEEDYETLPVIKREHSFIGRRRTSCGKEGVLALFGRFNVNLTMTRSIGDKYAARSCVALPEIFSCDVAASEYARFIVASDGLWDVMTSVEAHKFIRGFADPSKAAIALATKARMFRETNKWRIDDISVIVVDVNPHLRSELGGTGCACVIS